MTGALILGLWIGINLGLAGGAIFVAQRRHGVQVLSAKFLAETATVGAIFGGVIWGLSLFGVATGIAS